MAEDGVVVGRRPQDAAAFVSAPLKLGANANPPMPPFSLATIWNICGATLSSGAQILIRIFLFPKICFLVDSKFAFPGVLKREENQMGLSIDGNYLIFSNYQKNSIEIESHFFIWDLVVDTTIIYISRPLMIPVECMVFFIQIVCPKLLLDQPQIYDFLNLRCTKLVNLRHLWDTSFPLKNIFNQRCTKLCKQE